MSYETKKIKLEKTSEVADNKPPLKMDWWWVLFICFILRIISGSLSTNTEIEQDGLYFYWYDCTDDCSWHQAWRDRADYNDVSSESDCSWYSHSFIEWCRAFVEHG